MKTGTRPGVPARQPGDGLHGLAGPAWMEDALCRLDTFRGEDITPDLWFPTTNAYSVAKRVCDACPVAAQCLHWAMANESSTSWARFGLWGGLTPDERAALAKETA